MNAILKYKLKQQDLQFVEMPVGARLISAHSLGMHVWVWAMVDMEVKKKERRWFAVYKTGQPIDVIPAELINLGTVQFEEGALVLHVFEFVGS